MGFYFAQQNLQMTTFQEGGAFPDQITEVGTIPFARSTSFNQVSDKAVPNFTPQFVALVGTAAPLMMSCFFGAQTKPFNLLVRFVGLLGNYEINFRSAQIDAVFQFWTDQDIDDLEITFDGFEPLDLFTYDIVYEQFAETPLFLPKGLQVF